MRRGSNLPAVSFQRLQDEISLAALQIITQRRIALNGSRNRITGGSLEEIFRLDDGALRQNSGAFNRMPQFANVAGPVVGEKCRLGDNAQSLRNGVVAASFGEKRPGKPKNIIAAFAQRRQAEMDDIDAIVQVAAEAPLLDELLQITVGGANQSQADGNPLFATNSYDLALLDGT
jgi:hypothetical protein